VELLGGWYRCKAKLRRSPWIEVEAQILSCTGGGLWRCELGNGVYNLNSLVDRRNRLYQLPTPYPVGDTVFQYDLHRGRIVREKGLGDPNYLEEVRTPLNQVSELLASYSSRSGRPPR